MSNPMKLWQIKIKAISQLRLEEQIAVSGGILYFVLFFVRMGGIVIRGHSLLSVVRGGTSQCSRGHTSGDLRDKIGTNT